jgi:hypothetical protein
MTDWAAWQACTHFLGGSLDKEMIDSRQTTSMALSAEVREWAELQLRPLLTKNGVSMIAGFVGALKLPAAVWFF